MESLPPLSSPYERLLVRLDAYPVGPLLRFAVGYSVMPLWIQLAGRDSTQWWVVLWFVAVLLAMRLLPTLFRKILRFPPGTAAIWRYRRTLAKRFDSYQWRKLLPIGIGMLAYGATTQRFPFWAAALGIANIVAGSLGEWAWRTKASDQLAAVPPPMEQAVSTHAERMSAKSE